MGWGCAASRSDVRPGVVVSGADLVVPGGITRAVGGIKENGFSQVVGPALDRGKLFWVEAVWRRVRTLDRDVWFLVAILAHSFLLGGLIPFKSRTGVSGRSPSRHQRPLVGCLFTEFAGRSPSTYQHPPTQHPLILHGKIRLRSTACHGYFIYCHELKF